MITRQIDTYRNILFVLLALLTLWAAVVGLSLAPSVLTKICLALILVFGILHGSNDILLQRLQKPGKRHYFAKGILIYLVLVLLVYGIYLANSAAMLLLFILYSAYHFGEESSQELIPEMTTARILWNFTYGGFIFLCIFKGSWEELNGILVSFNLGPVSDSSLLTVLVPMGITQFIILFALYCLGKIGLWDFIRIQMEIAMFIYLFQVLNLLASFTLFFVFWHSIPSIGTQIEGIRKYIPGYSLKRYLWDALPIYAISLIGILATLTIFDIKRIHLAYIIVVSACVTLPHIITMAIFHYSPKAFNRM